jgi:hypothetical protein
MGGDARTHGPGAERDRFLNAMFHGRPFLELAR